MSFSLLIIVINLLILCNSTKDQENNEKNSITLPTEHNISKASTPDHMQFQWTKVKEYKDNITEEELQKISRTLKPGSGGYKLGILGGSEENPLSCFYTGESALTIGTDEIQVFCTKSGFWPLTYHSRVFKILPFLDDENSVHEITSKLKGDFYSLLIGTGLEKEIKIYKVVISVIKFVIENKKNLPSLSLILTEQGIDFLAEFPNIFQNFDDSLYIVSNITEINKLTLSYFGMKNVTIENHKILQELIKSINRNAVIILEDQIYSIITVNKVFNSSVPIGLYRCFGQDNILAGILGLYSSWAKAYIKNENYKCKIPPEIIASYVACSITRITNKYTCKLVNDKIVAPHMIEDLVKIQKVYFSSEPLEQL